MIHAILKAMGLASKTAKILKDQAVPNNVVSNSVAIIVNGTTKLFKITRSEGRHIPAANDACLFTFISEDAKQTVSMNITGFSKLEKGATIIAKDRKDGFILYCPNNRVEPVITYSSTKVTFTITEINHFDRYISGTFRATGFEQTEDMAEYKPSASFSPEASGITGSFCKCKFHS